jgi:hypothetical protein
VLGGNVVPGHGILEGAEDMAASAGHGP